MSLSDMIIGEFTKRLAALDLNRDGQKDLQEIITSCDSIRTTLAPVADKLTQDDVLELIRFLNSSVLGDRLTEEDMEAIAAAIKQIMDLLQLLEGMAENVKVPT